MTRFQVNIGKSEFLRRFLNDLWAKKYPNGVPLREKHLKEDYSFIGFDNGSYVWRYHTEFKGEPHVSYPLVSFEEAVKLLTERAFAPITVKLNNDYTAIVSNDGVKVGCQDFSFEKIEELATAVKKAQEFEKKKSLDVCLDKWRCKA